MSPFLSCAQAIDLFNLTFALWMSYMQINLSYVPLVNHPFKSTSAHAHQLQLHMHVDNPIYAGEYCHRESFGHDRTVLPKVGRNAGVSAVLNVEDALNIRKVHKPADMDLWP